MKKSLVVAAFAALAVLACGKGQDGNNNNQGSDPQLTGSWVSQGADVAPLLAGNPFNYTKIAATFNANGTYIVDATDKNNTTTRLEGTYTSTASTVTGIRDIVLNQTVPSTLTSTGIYQIDPATARMNYEVVQTQPPIQNVTPPTAAGGIGSTSNGAFGTSNVQKYQKQ
ncbi:MAG TPA: hypothetical protein VK447_12335 [Myxococcaceae bacterium]|nr:hypothetical protein [Myxococcaceae bacterium]